MKYFVYMFLTLSVLSVSYTVNAEDLSVTQIDVQASNTLEVILSENPNLGSGEIEAWINILNDLDIEEIFIDEWSQDEVILKLNKEILPEATYSLVAISGMRGSIDFITPWMIEGYTATNANMESDQDLVSIAIIDSKTLKIQYNEELESQEVSDYEFKLLLENPVISIQKWDIMSWVLNISVERSFEENQQYILMFLDVQDVSGNYLEFDTGIYDFETGDMSELLQTEAQEVQDVVIAAESEDLQTEAENSEQMQEEVIITPLNAAPSLQKSDGWVQVIQDVKRIETAEVSLEREIEKIENAEQEQEEVSTKRVSSVQGQGTSSAPKITKSIQEVATSATTTPATWAASWILVVMSLIINTIYYCTRKKAYKLI